MKRFDLITPEGTGDSLFEDCLARRSLEDKLRKVFTQRGYSEVTTPGIEFYDVFAHSSRYFPQENMYKLVDAGGRLLVLRPDSTVPIARVTATRLREAALPLRLFYNQSVFEATPSLRGRSDETVQMGIELIGSASRKADLEVLSTAIEALKACDAGDFRLEIGSIGFCDELLSRLPLEEEIRQEARACIEAKDYPALGDILKPLGGNPIAEALRQLPMLFGGGEAFEKAESIYTDAALSSFLAKIRAVYDDLCALGGDYRDKIAVDLGLVNRTDYYSGIMFRGYVEGCGEAVLSGGRYDHLIADFGHDLPATGFAINVDALAKSLRRSGRSPSLHAAEVLVFGGEGCELAALLHVNQLLAAGISAEYAVCDTSAEACEYAKRRGIARVDVISESGSTEVLPHV